MKVYVDELPKSCRECFCNVESAWAYAPNDCRAVECFLMERDERTDYTKQVRKEVVGEIIVDIRSLFNSFASSLIDYCIWNKNADENQKLYNNFKRIINDRLKKVLELFNKRIDQMQGDNNE